MMLNVMYDKPRGFTMKRAALIATLAIFTLAACDEKPAEKPAAVDPATSQKMPPAIEPGTPLPSNHPAMGADDSTGMMTSIPEAIALQRGTVISSIDVPQFTYIEIKQGDQTRWLASTSLAVKKGDVVEFSEDSTMENFTSKSLNRTFSSLTFVKSATVANDK